MKSEPPGFVHALSRDFGRADFPDYPQTPTQPQALQNSQPSFLITA
jgi:hypothetical protein